MSVPPVEFLVLLLDANVLCGDALYVRVIHPKVVHTAAYLSLFQNTYKL